MLFFSLAIFCSCTACSVSDMVGNAEDRFLHGAAQLFVSEESLLYESVAFSNTDSSRKHLRTKVTPDFHLTYSKNGGNLGSESK